MVRGGEKSSSSGGRDCLRIDANGRVSRGEPKLEFKVRGKGGEGDRGQLRGNQLRCRNVVRS